MRRRRSAGARLAGCLLALLATAAGAADVSVEERVRIQAFLDAARDCDVAAVREALDAGMPVDATQPPRDPRHPYTVRTALESAALYGCVEGVRLLLARGASLRRDARRGVYAASMHTTESPELLALLAAHAGADADLDADFGPALVRAAANGAAGEVAYLLSIGVDPDYRSAHEPWDEPAIVRAGTHLGIVEMLLAAGADPSGGALPYVWSPLLPAARALDVERTRRFLARGVDPGLVGPQGNALSLAACHAPRTARPGAQAMDAAHAVVTLLLDAGVDPNVAHDGRTPLRCAEESGNLALAAALEAAGGRSRESLWHVVKRGVRSTAVGLAVLLGGGM